MGSEKKKDLTILGFDFGTKYIGIAVGQTITNTAQPLTSLRAHHGKPDWDDIHQIIQLWQADALIVGLPLNMDGTEQPITQQAKQFAKQLNARYDLPIHTIDERLTTAEAKQQLFDKHGYKGLEKQNIDSFSAKLIVEDWLRQQNS